MEYRQNILSFRYPFAVRQTMTQSLQPNTTYDFVLSGFNGVFTELRFSVNPSNASGNDMKTYYRIGEWELLDQNGVNTIGGSFKTHEQSQYLDYPKHYDNDQNLHLDIYRYAFSFDAPSMVNNGQVMGYLPLNGRDQIRIRTGDAEVPFVQTITRNAGGAVSAGVYQLVYRGYRTDILAFNATPATIELALEALPPFLDNLSNVTVSAALTGDPITITWAGKEAEEYPNELIYVESLDVNDGVNTIYFESLLTTDYIPGFPAGSAMYSINFSGVSVHRLESKMGELVVYSS